MSAGIGQLETFSSAARIDLRAVAIRVSIATHGHRSAVEHNVERASKLPETRNASS